MTYRGKPKNFKQTVRHEIELFGSLAINGAAKFTDDALRKPVSGSSTIRKPRGRAGRKYGSCGRKSGRS